MTTRAEAPPRLAAGLAEGAAPAARPAPEAGTSEPRVAPALRLLNIGYGNLVVAARVLAIVSPQSAPLKRLRAWAEDRGKLIDATQGRRTRSILVLDSDHIVLSAVNPETIAARLAPEEGGAGSSG